MNDGERVAMRTIKRQRGFTMLEVLISVVVLSIGMLGIAGLQAVGQRNNNSAYLRSQATALAYDMIDRMRANQAGVDAGAYDGIDTVASNYVNPGCSLSGCTAATMAAYDKWDWEAQLAARLPSGNGSVANNGGVFTVTVMWDDNRNGASSLECGADALTCFTVSSRL